MKTPKEEAESMFDSLDPIEQLEMTTKLIAVARAAKSFISASNVPSHYHSETVLCDALQALRETGKIEL